MIYPKSVFPSTTGVRLWLIRLLSGALKLINPSPPIEALTACQDENSDPYPKNVDAQHSMADGPYVPGGDFPGREPDDVIKLYCGHLLGDNSWEEESTDIDSRDKDTPDAWVPRHKDLVRLTGRHPFNCEAQLHHLFQKGFITPRSLHYVRNHGAAPQIAWEDHTLHIGGLVPKHMKLTMRDIASLPAHSLPVTLVCCGNRRKEQNMIKQTKGFNWGAAGVSTGVWTGVRLADILRLAGVRSIEDWPRGMHVRFASESELGGDKLPSGVYGTSVPLEKALDLSQDIIIAYMYNGKLLTPDHGYPVRVIIPGYVGGRMIKWLTNIDLLDTISQDYYHFFDNRVLPPHVDAEIALAEGWWHKPEYICNELNINSAIAKPNHDEELRVVPGASYLCEGYAYTGGGRRVTRVEVSLNSGAVWKLATLKVTEKPTRYNKHWCWCFWEIDLPHEELARAKEIVLRAHDEGHNMQPDKPTWNLLGMLNNPWFRIKIHKSGDTLTFEHPTMAGNQNGGWMLRMKEHPALTSPGVYDPSTGANAAEDEADAAAASGAEGAGSTEGAQAEEEDADIDPSKPSFTMDQVAEHNTAESAWIVVKNKVYDCTPFLKEHPGGKESILISAGTECTEEFDAIHSKKAWKMLDDYYIGNLKASKGDSRRSSNADRNAPNTSVTFSRSSNDLAHSINMFEYAVALNPRKKIPFTMTERIVLSPDSLLLRFALQTPAHILGLPVGQHMLFSAKVDGKLVMRAYTPTSSDYDVGYFDLVIKVYRPNAQFPEGGKMSQYLGDLKVGQSIDVKGPLGHVTYVGRGVMKLDDEVHRVKQFVCLCAGTGITPIYQVLCAVLRDASDETKLHMIFANRFEVDILLKDKIDALVEAHPNRLHVHYILSSPSDGEQWLAGGVNQAATRSIGRVNTQLVKEKFPEGGEDSGCYALLCGPEAFQSEACAPALEALGYPKDMCVYF